MSGPKNHLADGGSDLSREGELLRGRVRVPARYNEPTHECITRSSAAAGECACPAHAADECVRRREGWVGDKTAKLL